jgi:hypothetical protein
MHKKRKKEEKQNKGKVTELPIASFHVRAGV